MNDKIEIYEKTMMDEDETHVYPDLIALRCNVQIFENGDSILTMTDKEHDDFNIKKIEIFLTRNKLRFLKNFLNQVPELK